MTELDKFKRRMVRTVARLLLHEKRPEDEVWDALRKETGCDCQLLWKRMRQLTMKKLNRLLAADDMVDNLASVARMSLTDWLLFDLALAHEKFDVIGSDKMLMDKADCRPLRDLYSLVQRYKVEEYRTVGGQKLIDAWATITYVYNKQGRQCSHMLLQRRWYQMKEATRSNFYQLWQNYRGNPKAWDAAQAYKPNQMQLAIAKRFPHVVTQPFPDWEEMIQKKLVILPEVFAEKHREARGLTQPACEDKEPDLVMIEPVIETIEIGEDSESEDTPSSNKDTVSNVSDPQSGQGSIDCGTTDVDLSLVKKEPLDNDGLSNVQIIEATHIPIEGQEDLQTHNELENYLKKETEVTENLAKRPNLSMEMKKFFQCTEKFDEEAETLESLPVDLESFPVDAIDVEVENIEKNATRETSDTVDETVLEKNSNEESSNTVEETAFNEIAIEETNTTVKEAAPLLNEITEDVDHEIKKALSELKEAQQTSEGSNDSILNDIIKQKADEYILKTSVQKLEADLIKQFDLPTDMDFADDGIQFVDDGIEYVDEENCETVISTEPVINTEDIEEIAKFDLKLLMNPVVYTTKLDQMFTFKGNTFDSVTDKDIINSVLLESKPKSEQSVNVNAIQKEKATDSTFDTTASTDNIDITHTQSSEILNYESENEPEISEEQKVKLSSFLLQKPRSRSYNPIQLCKNPDFNTRLKRLTAGFFCSQRNQWLLKECKPMTIDLHKAFESKLVDGTLYLKSGSEIPKPIVEECEQMSTILPSAMPIQSLINTAPEQKVLSSETNESAIDLTKNYTVLQRNTVINLRDWSEIQEINQKLRTAEVSPIRVHPELEKSSAIITPQEIKNEKDETSAVVVNDAVGIVHESEAIDVSNDETSTTMKDASVETSCTGKIIKTYTRGRGRGRGRPSMERGVEGGRGTYKGTGKERGRGTSRGTGTERGRGTYRGRGMVKNPNFRSWYPALSNQVSVPWNKPKVITNKAPVLSPDSLITIDTLNKMINKINGTEEYINPKKKNKRPNWVVDRSMHEADEIVDDDQSDTTASRNDQAELKTSKNDQVVTTSSKKAKESAHNYTKVDEINDKVKKDPPKKTQKFKVLSYCCWAREKLEKLGQQKRINKRHMCVSICSCCCALALAEMQRERRKQAYSVAPIPFVEIPIVLSDDEDGGKETDKQIQDNHNKFSHSNTIPLIQTYKPHFPVTETVSTIAPTPGIEIQVNIVKGDTGFPKSSSHQSEFSNFVARGFPLPVDSITANERETVENYSPELISDEAKMVDIMTQTGPAIQINICTTTTSTTDGSKKSASAKSHNITFTQNPPANKSLFQVTPPKPKKIVMVTPQKANTRDKLLHQGNTTVQRRIVIDGSKPGLVTGNISVERTEKKNEKIVYMNKNYLTMKPADSPIFLGKNKILLTTVKFPQDLNGTPKKNKEVPNPHVIPSLPLPEGVHLVLLPNGQLTYTVDSHVTLDEAQMAALPGIIATVQQQIDMSKPKSVVSLPVPPLVNLKEANSAISTASIADSANLVKESVLTDVHVVKENVSIQPSTVSTKAVENTENLVTTPIPSNSLTPLEEQESQPIETFINNETDLVKESTEVAKELEINSDKKSQEGNVGRNLLSDLMEMSGISAEDAKPVETAEVVSHEQPNLNMALTSNEVSPNSNIHVSNNQVASLPELSPITSVSELKYACAQNGQFFKLDFDTGVILPINVCIKMNRRQKSVISLAPKSVIDLTEDMEEVRVAEPNNSLNETSRFQPRIIKPLKLFKAVHSENSRQFFDKFNSVQMRRIKGRRKQRLDKIEAKIDLVDSDAPMEEEYLLESSDSETEHSQSVLRREDLAPSDSSDDEPLSKKFKRIRDKNSAKDNVSGENDGIVLNKKLVAHPHQSVDLPIEPIEEYPQTSETAMEDQTNVPTEETKTIDFVDIDNDSQDDCILGF